MLFPWAEDNPVLSVIQLPAKRKCVIKENVE
jgi:hypothetical protein